MSELDKVIETEMTKAVDKRLYVKNMSENMT